jgi:hypothetical protein
MQSRRRSTERQNIRRAAEYYLCCQQDPAWTFIPAGMGFEFSLDEMFTQVATMQARKERDEFPEVAIPRRTRKLRKEYAAEFAKTNAAKPEIRRDFASNQTAPPAPAPQLRLFNTRGGHSVLPKVEFVPLSTGPFTPPLLRRFPNKSYRRPNR